MALDGGKTYLAKRIVELMPAHTHYCEPFFGGGAVLLAKNPEGVSECVNDLHGELTRFWRVLQDEALFPRFCRRMEATPFSEEEWGRQVERLEEMALTRGVRSAADMDMACAFFIVCRQSMAGRMKSFAPLSKTRTRRNMNEQASAWLNAVEGLPAVHARLKRVAILGPKPAHEVIRQQDGPGTLFYLDPPYMHETRAAVAAYDHEMSPAEHALLLDLVKNAKGNVMLSGYQTMLYQNMLDGWNRHDFDLPNNSASGAEKRRMTESLWCNF